MPRAPRPSYLAASLGLLGFASAVIVAGAILDVAGRTQSPETVARRYFTALEASDVAGALAELAPSDRGRWVPFVENGVANEYRVLGVAIRHPSLISRFLGAAGEPTDLTVFLDITQAVDGVRWQATPRVPLVFREGRWFLAHPPLAPP